MIKEVIEYPPHAIYRFSLPVEANRPHEYISKNEFKINTDYYIYNKIIFYNNIILFFILVIVP